MSTNVHDIWDFIGSARCAVVCFDSAASINAVIGTTSVLKDANLCWSYMDFAKCAKCENLDHTFLNCFVDEKTLPGRPTRKILSDDDKSRLASIYAKYSAPIFCLVSFGGALWANIVGGSSFSPFSVHNRSASSGFSSEMKPTLMVSMKLNDKFAALEHSLASLVEYIDKLAKRLDSSGPMNQGANIVISKGSGVATGGKTIAGVTVCDSLVVSKIEETLKNLLIMVIDLLAKIDNTGLLMWKFTTCNVQSFNVSAKQEDIVYWHKESGNMIMNSFDEARIFTSGLDIGFLRTGVVEEVSGRTILVRLLFKGKVSVLVVGLYACVSPGDWFRQSAHSFVVLGGNFNKNKSKRNVSFSFCLSLGLVNSFGAEKIINHIFISGSLILVTASCKVKSVTEFFDTDHRVVLVLVGLGEHFMKCFSAKFLKKSGVFYNVEHSGNLDGMWNVLRDVIIDSTDMIFSKLWFSEFDSTKNRASSRFYGLEMLMSKIVNNIKTDLSLETGCFVDTWMGLNVDRAFKIWVMINEGTKTEDIVYHISIVKKKYCRSKYYEFRVVRDEFIRVAVAKYMENFCSDKERMIKSILDQPFKKVVFNYLIVDNELILEPQAVKSLVNTIIENYVNNDVFSEVMCDISLDELLVVVKKLPNGKAAELSGIPNKLWKHSGSLALNDLLNILNRYDVLCGDNFLMLKDTSTQFLIFAVGSIVKDALEKNKELWLVLQDIYKAYDSVGWTHLYNSLIRIKMCPCFISFFGGIHNGRFNQIMIDFGLSNSYIVHDGLDQEETITIPINQGVQNAELFISGSRISVAKKSDSHQYLGIFLSTEELSKPSLAKAHADDFSSVALHHPMLYGLKLFKQVFTESLMANLVNFSNMGGALGRFFNHRAMDLQAASWMPQHPLRFLVTLFISPLNCFLAGAMHALALCNTSLSSALPNVFRAGSGVPILDMLGMSGYLVNTLHRWKRLDSRSLISAWFVSVSNFVKFSGLSNDEIVVSCPALANVVWDTGFVFEWLFATRHGSIDVYTDSSVKSLGSIGVYSSAAAYFLKANISVGMRVLGLLSSTLVELQAIALVLECVFESSTIILFTDTVMWRKVKEHSGVIKNECANFFTNVATLSKSVLFLSMPYCFFSVEDRPVSGNVCHFVRKLFDAVNFVSWESKFGTSIVDVNFAGNVNSSKSFSIWHPDDEICFGYISLFSASLWSYLIKSLYCCLLVTVRKRLYDLKYPNVVYIRCRMVEKSDQLFLCKHNDVARLDILSNIDMK
ncbi:hypothetical protein G9A89_020849 [Geosiphon pyriformis]|nr:hypothetical protein G9A89_020849 [Geosiphon pyriformis]